MKNWFRLALTAIFVVACMISGQANAMTVMYPSNGIYSLQPQCAPGRELAVENASRNKGANVLLWSINSHKLESTNQRWRIQRLGSSRYYKIIAENTGFALDVEGALATAGTNVCVWPYGSQANQQFTFFDCGDGYCIIQVNFAGDYVLDVANSGNFNGANLIIWPMHGHPNQKWKLVRLGN